MRLFLGSTPCCLKRDREGRPVLIAWSGLGGIVLLMVGTVMSIWTLGPLAERGWWPGLNWWALLWLPAAIGIALALFGLNAAFERQKAVFDKRKGVVHFKMACLFTRRAATFGYDSAHLRIYRCKEQGAFGRRGIIGILAAMESWVVALDLPKGQVVILHSWSFDCAERAAEDCGRELGLRPSRAAGTIDPPGLF